MSVPEVGRSELDRACALRPLGPVFTHSCSSLFVRAGPTGSTVGVTASASGDGATRTGPTGATTPAPPHPGKAKLKLFEAMMLLAELPANRFVTAWLLLAVKFSCST